MRTVITAQCIDQTLTLTNSPKLASGGENVFQVEVTFDSYWSGYGKEAVFYKDKSRAFHVVMAGDSCVIPWELTAEPGNVHFSVRGVSGSVVRSSEEVILSFAQGAPVGRSYPEPLPDVQKQLMSAYGKNSQAIEVERARIDNLVSGGTVGDAELLDVRVGADGKTHGSAGGAVREQIKSVLGAVSTDISFEQGSIASADGSNTNNVTNRIRTGFILADNFNMVSVSTGFIVDMFQYTADLGYISTTQWSADGGKFDRTKIDESCRYLRFAVARTGAEDLSPETDTGFTLVTSKSVVTSELETLRRMMVSEVTWVSGTLNATTGLENGADTRIRTDFLPPTFERVTIDPGFYINLFQYDKDSVFLESTNFVTEIDPSIIRKDCAYIRFVIRRVGTGLINPTDDTGFALYRSDLSVYALNSKISQNYHSRKFNGEVMNTAYSTIGLAPINSAEHFQLAAHLGFNALKGDVRITADNKLIMCHDAGFTLDESGKVTSYNSSNAIVIKDTDYSSLMALEYVANNGVLGHYAKVCDFDTFIRICKENGKIAYITLRENKIPNLVSVMMDTLKKYRMEDHCVVNSYTLAALQEVRRYSSTIPLSMVISLGTTLTKETVDKVIPLGNSIVTMFLYPTDDPISLWNQSAEALAYAAENDVQIHMAQVNSYADYSAMVQRGVQGFHILKPFLPYNRADIQLTVTIEKGTAWVGNIIGSDRLTADIALNSGVVTLTNIRNVGSGYGYDDGLPTLWMNRLPSTVSVSCSASRKCSAEIKAGALVLYTDGTDGVYYINVSI